MKNKILLACLLIVAPGLLLSIAGCDSTGPMTVQQANYPPDRIDASKLYNENCATCHGQDGRAQTFRGRLIGTQNLTDLKWQTNTTDDQIISAIETGPKAMPAFEKELSSLEIHALTAYIRSFKPVSQEGPR
jgi:mono/diheme cytochrome c family protein